MDYGYDSDDYVLVSATTSTSTAHHDTTTVKPAIIDNEIDPSQAKKLAVRRSSLEAIAAAAALVPANGKPGEPLAAVFYRAALATALLAMFLTRLLSGFGGSFTNYVQSQARN
ncbi:hypothetical protein BDF22DRAFT_656501 [Syncephalis plumigaleata]|nr:hypothetical protein BDF22DRAFT_656501 [Syncephalis plumigaleata]